MAVAFLSYLGHLQLHGARIQPCTHGKASEINTLHHQVLAKSPVYNIGPALVEHPHLIIGEKAYLAVPVARVGISLNTEIHQKMPLFYGPLLNSPFITDTDGLHHSGGTDTLFCLL